MTNIATFTGGLALLSIGLWLVSPAYALIGAGMILLAVWLGSVMIPAAPKPPGGQQR
jgi:hypothetical protein